MKKLHTFLITFLAFGNSFCQVQTIDSISLSREIWRDSLLRMDKSFVPTGFLWEYSMFVFEFFEKPVKKFADD